MYLHLTSYLFEVPKNNEFNDPIEPFDETDKSNLKNVIASIDSLYQSRINKNFSSFENFSDPTVPLVAPAF